MPNQSSSHRNAVRIIGGTWKRSVITFPDVEGLRPTPDRVRETVFNWLGQDLSGRAVLDAFTGTGAMALEAASRGAAHVTALDTNAKVVQAVNAHALRLGGAAGSPSPASGTGALEVLRADALTFLGTYGATRPPFDIVFLDPPFRANLYPALEKAAPRVLSAHGLLYVEAPNEFVTFGGLTRLKHLRAGAVHAHVFSHGAVAP